MGTLELHTWGSRTDRIERPDRLTFDLDPDPTLPWEQLIDGAYKLRERLSDLGLSAFVKTTGGKGLHVVAPIARRHGWEDIKEFSKMVAESVVREAPERYTSVMSKTRRKGKIFIDYLRNARGATAVAAYSTRARPGAPVSVPLGWEELSPGLRSDHFTVRNLSQRLSRLRKDPWENYEAARRPITEKSSMKGSNISSRMRKRRTGTFKRVIVENKEIQGGPMEEQIGNAAGNIWEYLSHHGETPLRGLERGTKLSSRLVLMGLGWLAREGKLNFVQDRNTMKISLKES
jgi:hypothetical protein